VRGAADVALLMLLPGARHRPYLVRLTTRPCLLVGADAQPVVLATCNSREAFRRKVWFGGADGTEVRQLPWSEVKSLGPVNNMRGTASPAKPLASLGRAIIPHRDTVSA
jgi:hypothetical protein